MRKYYLMAIMLIAGLSISYSQVETHYLNSGEALKHINKPIRSVGIIKEMPSFDLAQLEKEDAERDSIGGMFRFGKPFDVSYTLADGQWEDVDGGRIWSMTFKSKDALSLNFIFNDFRLPEGAELYVVNKDESVLFGPVTKESTTENGYFLTDIMKGDQATIYLFEPTDSKGLSSLTISRVVHGYRDYETKVKTDRSVYTPDVACYPAYNMASDAVAMILQGNGYCVGTGFLIMDADHSFKPYFLTSYFVIDSNNSYSITSDEISDAENSSFKFRFKNASCEGSNPVTSYTYNQAKIRAYWKGTYFALLEIKGILKQNQALAWLGWTRSDGSVSAPACIHHLNNDVMKISFASSPVSPDSFSTFWSCIFMYNGTVHPCSIGAPLINEDKRVMGHLSSIQFLNPNDEFNTAQFGQFEDSWFGNGTADTRLRNWLDSQDPDNNNIFQVDTRRSLGNLQIIGDSAISVDGSSYYVSNLPSGMTVEWSITDNYYQGVLEEDEPNTNQCTIYGDVNHEMLNDTLTAYVKSGTTLVQSASKIVSTQEVFHGTYYNGQTTKQINLPNPLYVLPGTQVCITSPNLVGASAYYNGNVTPYIWSFDNSNGILYVGMPSSPSGTAVINVHVTTALGNSFTLPIVRASTVYSMSVGVNHKQITVSLVADEDAENQLLRDGNTDGSLSSKQVSWTLEVINATTGKKVFNQQIEGTDFTFDTTGWEPGVYIVKVTIGNEEFTEKVIVR